MGDDGYFPPQLVDVYKYKILRNYHSNKKKLNSTFDCDLIEIEEIDFFRVVDKYLILTRD